MLMKSCNNNKHRRGDEGERGVTREEKRREEKYPIKS